MCRAISVLNYPAVTDRSIPQPSWNVTFLYLPALLSRRVNFNIPLLCASGAVQEVLLSPLLYIFLVLQKWL